MSAAALALLLLHGDSVSSSRIEIDGCEARVTFTFSMEDLAERARLDTDRSGIVEPEEWRRVMPALHSYLGERFRIDGCRSEGDLEFLPPAIPLKERRAPVTLRMRYVSASPLSRLPIRCELFHEHEGSPRHVAEGPGGRVIVFDRERPESVAGISPTPATAARVMLPLGAAAAAMAGVALMWRYACPA